MSKLLIQVYSDLHIEMMKNFPRVKPTAKYLFLVGDICQLNNPLFFNFFDYCSPLWEKIFYTPGNHEFYFKRKNYDELNFEYQLKFRERYKNVFYLNNNSAPLNDEIDVYGSVFWTCSYNSALNDYREINQFSETKKYNIPIDYKFMKSLSDESLKSISNYLNRSTKKTIVMTHFPPLQTGTSNPVYDNQSQVLKDYFAWNNILKDLNLNNVPLWLSGHTHWSYDIIYNNENSNNTRLLSNQLGYSQEVGRTNIIEDGLFEINM